MKLINLKHHFYIKKKLKMSSSSLLLTVQSPQYGFKFLIKSQLLSLPLIQAALAFSKACTGSAPTVDSPNKDFSKSLLSSSTTNTHTYTRTRQSQRSWAAEDSLLCSHCLSISPGVNRPSGHLKCHIIDSIPGLFSVPEENTKSMF